MKFTRKKRPHRRGGATSTIRNRTPISIMEMNVPINNKSLVVQSYAPSINQRLVSLKSIAREDIEECNNKQAFLLKESLQIKVKGKCYPYYSNKAKEFLLHNLQANKHIDSNKIITPVQSHSNCWFNTMFVALFMSDKGRKFFHFFRQLMIQGKQANGDDIPAKLRDSFSLLNFAIESCLTGNKYAYVLDTNNIIRHIFLSIPDSYKKKDKYLVDIDYANNPVYYYNGLMNYLNADSLSSLIVNATSNDWKRVIEQKISAVDFVPHYIILEIFDGTGSTPGNSGIITNKERSFTIGEYTYLLDSCIIRDVEQQHFTATLTCEGKEMAYDGASFHRLVPMKWKNRINTDNKWKFKGTEYPDGRPLNWSFRQGYQMLFYYRTK